MPRLEAPSISMTSTSSPDGDGGAWLALVAGLVGGAFDAVERLGEDARHGGLADAARPAEEVGVRHAVELDGVLEGLGDDILPDETLERPRAVFSRQNQIRHNGPEKFDFRASAAAGRTSEKAVHLSSVLRPERRQAG